MPQGREIGFLKNVNVSLGGISILENINLTLFSSEFVSIIGPNGSGKTTLIKTLLGIIPSISGEIQLLSFPAGKYPAGSVGYLPQFSKQNINFPAKVVDVIMMGRFPLIPYFKQPSIKDLDIVTEKLELLKISEYKDSDFQKLSGGLKQRVLIARALSTNPKILILDEPLTSLDIMAQHDLYKILTDLKTKGTSILIISHDIGTVSMYVDKIICLNKTIHFYGSGCIPSDIVEKVFGKDMMFVIHDKECFTCKQKRYDNNIQ